MKEQETIKLTKLNNKSRKGLYVYIKKKGGHGRYYKYTGKIGEFEAYKEQYKTKSRKTAKKYLKEIEKRPEINKIIKKGITTAEIENATKINRTTIIKKRKELLKSLILDKQILKQMSTDQNFNKLKSRLEYRIKIKDKKGNTLITANKFNQTIEETINELIKSKPEGQTARKTKTTPFADHLKQKGWNEVKTIKEGTIEKISMTIIFRKG